MQGPHRTCIACRTRRSPHELLRFRRAASGEVVALIERRHALAGRSAWLCPSASCFADAERQRAFARAFATRRPSGKPELAEVRFEALAAWTEVSRRIAGELELLDRTLPKSPASDSLLPHARREALAHLALQLTSPPPTPPRSSASSRKGTTRKGREGGSPTHG